MLKFITQIFCDHIWKMDKTEYLGHSDFGMPVRHWAAYKRCIRCDRRKITKHREFDFDLLDKEIAEDFKNNNCF